MTTRRQVPAQELYALVGYSCSRAWTFASIHAGLLLPTASQALFPRDIWQWTVVGTLAMLAALLIAGVRRPSPRSWKTFAAVLGVFACAVTAGIGVISRMDVSPAWIAFLSALLGVGSASMTVFWGVSFLTVGAKPLWKILPGAFLLSLLLTYALSAFPEFLAGIGVCLLPAVSVVCGSVLCEPSHAGRAFEGGRARGGFPLAFEGRPARLHGLRLTFLYNSLSFGLALGYLRGVGAGGQGSAEAYLYEFAVVALFMAALVVLETVGKRGLRIEALYRVVSFGMVAVYMVFCLSPAQNLDWAFPLATGCFECFYIIWWMVTVETARKRPLDAPGVFVVGRLAVVLGMLLGMMLGSLLGTRYDGASVVVAIMLTLAIVVLSGKARLFPEDGSAVEGHAARAAQVAQADGAAGGSSGGLAGGSSGGAEHGAEGGSEKAAGATSSAGAEGRPVEMAPAGSGRSLAAAASRYALTKRETEVFALLAQGYNAASISKKLVISENTAKSHIKNVYRKVGVDNQQDLIERSREAR